MDKNKIYLAQTDTTVGFLSSDNIKLSQIKKRTSDQKILQVVDGFDTLKQNVRVPNKYKNLVRKSKFTTFIYPSGESFRVVCDDLNHYQFVNKFKILYSTSANQTAQAFSFDYASDKADILVFQKENFYETKGSKIFKISNLKLTKIR